MHPDSSNVQLPVLPDAKMETRSEMRFPQCRDNSRLQRIMANCQAGVNTKSPESNC